MGLLTLGYGSSSESRLIHEFLDEVDRVGESCRKRLCTSIVSLTSLNES